MSRSVFSPNVSASLIHEIRMVLNSFFMSRNISSWSRPASSAAMKCISCIRADNPRPKDAIAIKDGQSVCQLHALA